MAHHLETCDVTRRGPRAEFRSMAQRVEKAYHPTTVGPIGPEQLEHLLVRPAISAGEVMDHEVLDVKVPDGNLVGIPVGDGERLGDGPLANTGDTTQEPGCALRV